MARPPPLGSAERGDSAEVCQVSPGLLWLFSCPQGPCVSVSLWVSWHVALGGR